MYKDISGNTLSVGDSVFVIKSFVKDHFSSSYELDNYPDIIDQELEEARQKGYIDPSLSTGDDQEFKYYTDEPESYKRYIDNDNYVFDDEDIDFSEFEVSNSVQLLSSADQSSQDILTGKIVKVEPSNNLKIEQLSISIDLILEADNEGRDGVEIDDYLFKGTLQKPDFNSAILLRSDKLNSIPKLKQDRSEPTLYIKVIDHKGKNNNDRSILNSVYNYIEQTLNEKSLRVLCYNLNEENLLNRTKNLIPTLPGVSKDSTEEEILQVYTHAIISQILNVKITEVISFKEKVGIYSLIKRGLDRYLSATGKTSFNEEEVNYICDNLSKKKPEYILAIQEFNTQEFMEYTSTSKESNLHKGLIWLNFSEKETYLNTVKWLLDNLKYLDGVSKFSPTEVSKLSADNNIEDTINKIAVSIEKWFIHNESKALKSILG